MTGYHETLSNPHPHPHPHEDDFSLWRNPNPLDDFLLDLCAIIELSDNDRAVADRRYGLLQRHLERPASPLRELVKCSTALIYAQGSMAIGATIVSGTEDDRFDVDAIVEFPVPEDWSDSDALDKLEHALEGFPGAVEIVRCTRCVQIQFAYMHMDVTILDPASDPRSERVGEIFHSPDDEAAYRVPSNPYGFSCWYRRTVIANADGLLEALKSRRKEFALDRLNQIDTKADQEDLPPVIPPRFDAQQVVALKLLKRFVNLQYCESNLKRPPSIYLTKMSADCGFSAAGLTAQLESLSGFIEREMLIAHQANDGPNEENPTYPADKINDRWPKTQADRKTLAAAMGELRLALNQARQSDIGEIKKILAHLFGERVSTTAYEGLAKRKADRFVPGRGTILSSATVASFSVREASIPAHRFHSEDDQE